MTKKYPILLIIFVLALVSLACNLVNRFRATPVPTIPVTTEAVQSLEATAENAYQQAQQTGDINITINEAQITSLVALKIDQFGQGYIHDPQIYLRDGQVLMTGTVSQNNFQAKAKIVLEVSVDADGKPVFHVVSATVGPFSIPSDLVSQFEAYANQVFTQQIESMAPNLFIDSIVIANGEMTITGRTK